MAEADKEGENFFRLVKLIVDVSSEVLRDVLLHIIKPHTLDNFLQTTKPEIDRQRRLWFDNEYKVLSKKPPNSNEFDITLLVKILRHLCPLICTKDISPTHGWKQSPGPNDIKLGDDIQRLREIRNSIFAHVTSTKVTDDKFQVHWTNLTAVTTRAAGHGSQGMKQQVQDKINTIKTENVMPSSMKYLVDMLRKWHEEDKEEFKNMNKQLKQQVAAVSELGTKVQDLVEKVDEMAANLPSISEKQSITNREKLQLRQYLIDGYKQKLEVTLLPQWEQLPLSEIFTPSVLVCDEEKQTHEKAEFRNLETYKQLFYNNNVLQKRVILLGEAGAGKTTFTKHLTDAWCGTTTQTQFADVDVLKQFSYLFSVSCRFAEEKETLLDMINNQLFNDSKMKEVALYMFKNYPECCIIVLDGADEWKGSPTSETGRRGDIVGLPGMTGVDGCVILITTRPWRFHALPKKTKNIFRRLEINGVKDVKYLAFSILKELKDPDPAISSQEFVDEALEKDMFELIENPLILVISLGGWVGDRSLHRSITINYINLIQSFIRRSKGEAGWLESKGKQLQVSLDNLESEWGQQVDKLPKLLMDYKPLERYAVLFLSLGRLAFELLLGNEEQSLVFSQEVLKTYLPADEENDVTLSVCLALGILSKTETATRGIKKLESYSFCHKTFQEFFAVLWLASEGSNEISKLCKCTKSYRDLMSNEILIRFLCGFDPDAGRCFWKFVAEEVRVMTEEEEQEHLYSEDWRIKKVTDLVCKCMKEHGFYPKDQKSDQIYLFIPHIAMDNCTSDEDKILLHHVLEKYSCSIKSLNLEWVTMTHHGAEQLVKSCAHLETLQLKKVKCREHGNACCIHVLDLQNHNKLETLKLQKLTVEGLLLPSITSLTLLKRLKLCCLPVNRARIRSLSLQEVTMTHHDCEQLSGCLLSYSGLEFLVLGLVGCRDHPDSCCIPVLNLKKHNMLEKLMLYCVSVEGLLLPEEGAIINLLSLYDVTMTHHGCEQLSGCLLSYSGLEYLTLDKVRCREHSDSCIFPVLNLQKHTKLETLELNEESVEGLLLPEEGPRITSLNMCYITMKHDDYEQLSETLLSYSGLEFLDFDEVRCGQHGEECCCLVLNLLKHKKLERLRIRSLSIKDLLLLVEEPRITSLSLCNVTMTHNDCEQLSDFFLSYSGLEFLKLESVRCRGVKCGEHADRSCIHVLDLQKHNKLDALNLQNLSVERLLLIVEGARITSLTLCNVTMSHQGCEQLAKDFLSRPNLKDRCLLDSHYSLLSIKCREHCDSTCQHVEDISKLYKDRCLLDSHYSLLSIKCREHCDSTCQHVEDISKLYKE